MKALPVAVAVGVVLSGVLVWQASDSVFSPAGIERAGPAAISGEAAGQSMSPGGGAVTRAFQGTLAQLVSRSSDWATGLHGAPVAPPDLTRSLRYSWTTDPAMPGSTQDGSIMDVALVFGAQSS
jgi:hypothetical protein